MDKPQIIAHIQKSLNFTANDCKWIPTSAKFVVLGNHPRMTGALEVYEISHADVKLVHKAEKTKGFYCSTFAASSGSERHLATGGFDGKLNIWDIERTDLPIYSVSAHKDLIYGIDGVGGLGIGEGAPEIVTSGKDGHVKVWDPRQKNPVANMEPGAGEAKRECWTVAFGNSYNAHDRCVCAGYDNGDVKMFDLRKMALQWEHNIGNGICCVEFDRKDIEMNKLVVTSLESKFHVFDMRTQHPTKGFASLAEKAHGSTIWQTKHLPQNRDVFMTTGGNGSLNLWKYSYPNKRVTENNEDNHPMGVAGSVRELQNVTLSTQPIKSFDWSPDKMGLAVCAALDQTVRVLICTKLNTL